MPKFFFVVYFGIQPYKVCTVMNTPAHKPIPTRFRDAESLFLKSLNGRYALPTSEIIRRSVRLLKREMDKPGSEKLILSLVP